MLPARLCRQLGKERAFLGTANRQRLRLPRRGSELRRLCTAKLMCGSQFRATARALDRAGVKRHRAFTRANQDFANSVRHCRLDVLNLAPSGLGWGAVWSYNQNNLTVRVRWSYGW